VNRGLAAEWHKLRTTQTPWWLLALACGLALAVALVQLAVGDSRQDGLSIEGAVTDIRTSQDMREFLVLAGSLATFLALVLAVTLASGEYRYATIVRTALAAPRRWPVAVAKVLVAAGCGFVLGAAAVTTAAVVAVAWLLAHDSAVPFGAPAVLALVQLPTATALEGGLAAAVALLVRHQGAAFAVVFGWVFLAESLLAGLVPDSKRWLPVTGAAQALLSGPTDRLFGPWLGATVLAAYLAVATASAARALVRRDVP
jgi:hypothetical protein